MKKQIVVIGLGRLGESLATTLYDLGHDVLALDVDAERVQNIASRVTHAVQADATNEATLKRLGISNFEIAIVTVPDIGRSVLMTILLKKLQVPYVMARAYNELHSTILGKIGADRVFFPEHDMGVGIAHVLTLGDIIDYIPVANQYGVVKIITPASFVGKTLAELGFGSRGKWKVAVLLILRKQEAIINPSDSELLEPEDALILAGIWDRLNELFTAVQRGKVL